MDRQQLREAFPWHSPPCILLRDRDRIFGSDFTKVKELGIQEKLGAPEVPQQRSDRPAPPRAATGHRAGVLL
jgi:hypothetical protein